jgi:hypothetical protein
MLAKFIRVDTGLYELLKFKAAKEKRSIANMLTVILADALVEEMAEDNKRKGHTI